MVAPARPPSPPRGHGCPAAAEGMPLKHGQRASGTCFANTHLHRAGSTLRGSHHITHTIPRELRHSVPSPRAQGSRPSHEGCHTDGSGPPKARLMDGRAQGHVPRAAPLPHRRWSCASLTHVYCFIANRAVTKREEGPHAQGQAPAGACTDESPQQGESPTPGAAEPRTPQRQLQGVWLQCPPPQVAKGPAPGLASREIRANPVPSPKSILYLSKSAVLHIEDPILHGSLHEPSAALATSTRIEDLGYQQQRKCDCYSRSNCMGQTSFSQRLPLFGVWDEGQRLGHRRCPSVRPPPRRGAVGQNARRQSTGSTEGTARQERSTRRLHQSVWGTREQPPAEEAQNPVREMVLEGSRGFGWERCKTLATPMQGASRGSRQLATEQPLHLGLPPPLRHRYLLAQLAAAIMGCYSTAPHISSRARSFAG